MALGRYVVDAVLFGGRSPTELARSHGISRSRIYQLIARYREGGYEALEPRSRRPRSCSRAAAPEIQNAIVRLRQELADAGHDCGPHTIAHHLRLELGTAPSVATIWRILARHGLITPEPRKRPKSSFIRFEADLPNELWQTDSTHWQLADGTGVEILNCLDDHSRLLVVSDAFVTIKAADVVESLYTAWEIYGYPAALLSDNGAVFSGKTRKGKVLLESELERLGIVAKHSTPYHPRPAARSSTSTPPRRSSSTNRRRQRLWRSSRPNSTPSAPITTKSVRIEPCEATRPCMPSTPASRPLPPPHHHPSTTACATTASTSQAGSRCATSAGSITSASAARTSTSPSRC
jgi:transposase